MHEFGHLNNIYFERSQPHPDDDSVMRTGNSPETLKAGLMRYNDRHLDKIVVTLGLLWRAQQL